MYSEGCVKTHAKGYSLLLTWVYRRSVKLAKTWLVELKPFMGVCH